MSVENPPAALATIALVRIDISSAQLHAAESAIHIRIVGLKPISEGPPQHALIRTRRAALHHKMPAIEKAGGVAFVERKRLEPRKESKRGRCSLPSAAEEAIQSKWTP